MRLARCGMFALALFLGGSTLCGAAVKIEKKGDSYPITIDGQEFCTYQVSKEQPKPFMHPVKAADGALITRGLEKPEDHPHHKGIWCSIDEVNGIKFWAEKGRIENAGVKVTIAEGNPAEMQVTNHWLDNDNKPLLIETTTIRVFSHRLLTYDMTYKAAATAVTFEDTKEGMFGIRVANTMREKQGGTMVNADGLKGMKACWGLESKWVDYYGPVENKTYGVAIFEHPDNERKSRWHCRDYGLFTISPFGQKSYSGNKLPANPLTLEAGKSFRLRYGLYVHFGDTAEGKVADVYGTYVAGSK